MLLLERSYVEEHISDPYKTLFYKELDKYPANLIPPKTELIKIAVSKNSRGWPVFWYVPKILEEDYKKNSEGFVEPESEDGLELK